MTLDGYISYLSGCWSRKIDIGPAAFQDLLKFAINRSYSAYDIFKILKTDKHAIAYKNVHKRIQMLYSLDLIKKVKERRPRDAIPYRLTAKGIYYIFLKFPQFNYLPLLSNHRLLFENYHSDELFTIFVDPYLKLSTIKEVQHSSFHFELFDYLHSCCYLLSEMTARLETFGADTPMEAVSSGNENGKMLTFLERKLNIIFDQHPKITRSYNEITVATKRLTCTIKHAASSKMVTLLVESYGTKSKKQCLLNEFDFSIQNIVNTMSYKETMMTILSHQVTSTVHSFIFNLIHSRKLSMIDKLELKILASDDRFMKIAAEVHEGYKVDYEKLLRCRDNIRT